VPLTANLGGGSGCSDAAPTRVQGFAQELLVDDTYQPEGLLVRLHDDTMGRVARVVARRGKAAADAARAYARERRGSGSDDGGGGGVPSVAPASVSADAAGDCGGGSGGECGGGASDERWCACN
jgi:hypothetical protein